MKKNVALFIVLLGGIVAIAPYNPFGDPNLHPNPRIVLAGSIIAISGGLLILFAVRPVVEPKLRKVVWGLILIFVLLGGMGFVLP